MPVQFWQRRLPKTKKLQEDLVPMHLASLPNNLSPEIRKVIVTHVAGIWGTGKN
jgi:hypothetical protein